MHHHAPAYYGDSTGKNNHTAPRQTSKQTHLLWDHDADARLSWRATSLRGVRRPMLAGVPAHKLEGFVVVAMVPFAGLKRGRLRQRAAGIATLQHLHQVAEDEGDLRRGDLRVDAGKGGEQLVQRRVCEQVSAESLQEFIILEQFPACL